MPDEIVSIESKIYFLRGQRVMLDEDLAALYEVETKALVRAVKRNITRFPEDFMFIMTQEEWDFLRRQIGTSKGRGGRRYLPYVFTEHGVAMLSSVLRSEKAILVNIEIMRAFSRIRHILLSYKDLAHKLDALEQKYDEQFRTVFDAIRHLMSPPDSPKRRIGFGVEDRKG